MKLYNMRSKIKEHASLIKKNQSLSSHFLSQVKQRKQSLPKIVENDDYIAMGRKTEKKPSNHQALIDLKISQKEAEMPRNLVTNSIMSLQRRDNLERTLYVKTNMKNELKENTEKLLRKFDNIYFDVESTHASPDTKKQSPAQQMKLLMQTPQAKMKKFFNKTSQEDFGGLNSQIDDFVDTMKPQQDSFDYKDTVQEGSTKQFKTIVDMIDSNKDLDKIVKKYFNGKNLHQIEDENNFENLKDGGLQD